MVADEKRQEENAHEFDQEFRKFEEGMKEWRQEFAEEIKNYKW